VCSRRARWPSGSRLLLRSNGPSTVRVLSRGHSYGVCAIPPIVPMGGILGVFVHPTECVQFHLLFPWVVFSEFSYILRSVCNFTYCSPGWLFSEFSHSLGVGGICTAPGCAQPFL
jgi:hypothetical protein